MSIQDQMLLKPDDSAVLKPRNGKTFIPINFYVIADNDGTGGLDIGSILNEVSDLNNIFDTLGFYFYLTQGGNITTINNSNLANGPYAFVQLVASIKNRSALNVFISKKLLAESTPVAGYFTPGSDYIAIDAAYMGDKETLAHEIGHFFSLPHTFYGWDDEPYDAAKHGNPVNITESPNYGIPVELVDKTNCTRAGDGICDTPPDYNFGSNRSLCSYNGVVKDPNGDVIPIMKNNYMTYFSNCPNFMFTKGQQNAMINNYSGTSRKYLQSIYIPTMAPIADLVSINYPTNNLKIETYNYVTLDWQAVTNATRYYIEITDGREVFKVISSGTSHTFTDLKPNKIYILKIRPYSEGFTDTKNKIITFRTGNLMTATTEVTGSNIHLKVVPNPVSRSGGMNIEVDAGTNGTFQLEVFNMLGQTILSKSIQLDFGTNQLFVNDVNSQAGVHFVRIRGNKYDLTQKFILTE